MHCQNDAYRMIFLCFIFLSIFVFSSSFCRPFTVLLPSLIRKEQFCLHSICCKYQKQLENDTEKERLKIRCKKQKEKAKNSIWEREFVLHSAFDNA